MFELYLCQFCFKCYDLRCIWKGAAGAMSGGYVTVAVLIQLGLIPCSEVDLPYCWSLLYSTRELLIRLQWGCNEVLTSLGHLYK